MKKSKAYIVFTYTGYDDYEIIGVYNSQRKAITAYNNWYKHADRKVKEWNNVDWKLNNQIQEFDLL